MSVGASAEDFESTAQWHSTYHRLNFEACHNVLIEQVKMWLFGKSPQGGHADAENEADLSGSGASSHPVPTLDPYISSGTPSGAGLTAGEPGVPTSASEPAQGGIGVAVAGLGSANGPSLRAGTAHPASTRTPTQAPTVITAVFAYLASLAASAKAGTQVYGSFYGSARLFTSICANKVRRIQAASTVIKMLAETVQVRTLHESLGRVD